MSQRILPQRILPKRILIVAVLVAELVSVSATFAAVPADGNGLEQRYGMLVSEDIYPQATPRETIRSIIDAVENANARYVLAHLVSPRHVDKRLGGDQRAFEKLVSGISPSKSRQLTARLEKHIARGQWRISSRIASSEVDGAPRITLERVGKRWFMHNVPLADERLAAKR
ncbi:MAG: hypothetical protein DWQ31_15685 [Planctomycetota bacterium]|nr:MAG: hypothetical protein DWQ31_15685 [Planctomycetota bacterium]REJ89962.1 MAG: hypothetical protein DWQ35_17230 [Planctomycetota bacterium]